MVRVFVAFFCFFRTISQKLMQLGLPNLTYECSKTSPENPLILESEGQRSRSQHQCWSSERNISIAVYISHAAFSLL